MALTSADFNSFKCLKLRLWVYLPFNNKIKRADLNCANGRVLCKSFNF